ncbi:non-hydrolyzing UDP-N-acetylglucosamine 2-epimerase [Nocardiopsis quinghaiensis]|uniref:non-hydrolyzing UDP-N-acetylglucosamine 2-epimerase n=1 Tax=Nocardiopsis quinghaiensis TaxID=464995 RepID=UPI00123AA960|nr:UDP-N-acetylglucosamine 2-epimerase (non-hydrolyzing) [Nocardiopsis quinghaiensis]
MHSVSIILGTRPEAIKFAPVIHALREDPCFEPVVVSTGQHQQMLHETLCQFGLAPDVDLQIMTPRQTLSQVTARSLNGLGELFAAERPDAILVHGDTATTLAGALSGFHHNVPVIHVEAGLRSGHLASPFPEEGNRRLIAQVAALHLAPTMGNRDNLLAEGINEATIAVTGNTVIDALRWASSRSTSFGDPALDDLDEDPRTVIVASAHRRDAWPHLPEIGRAFAEIADRPDVRMVVPLHRNPAVREALLPSIGDHPGITVVDPMPYLGFARLMNRADIILSDSSGAQEEGPALGTPTLVISNVTERVEAVEAGTARLVSTLREGIVSNTVRLLDFPEEARRLSAAVNPYGDGRATERTMAAISHFFGRGEAPEPFAPEVLAAV